jgi:hypothetical protein
LTSSQVKLLITSDSFSIVQKATAVKKRFIRDYGVAQASPLIQAGWSDCIYMFVLFFCSFKLLTWNFRLTTCSYEGKAP